MSSEQETAMFWKVEPLSPSGTPPLDIDDEWLSFEEKPALLEDGGEEAVLYEEQLTRAQVASKFLEELELGKNWIKEESFADWLEEKIDLPIFEELPAPECGQNRAVVYPAIIKPHQQQHHLQVQSQILVGHHHSQHQHVDATQSLLREFETVLGDVEACHQIAGVSTLTPPQSPPPVVCKQQLVTGLPVHTLQAANAHLLVSLQPLHQNQSATFVYEQQHQQHREESANLASLQHQQEAYTVSTLSLPAALEQQQQQQHQQQQQQIADQWSAETLSLVPLVHSNDVAHELAKVDEYVRSCAEDVAATPGNNNVIGNTSSNASSISSSAPGSPCESSNASVSSEDSADDPDWSYESSVHASSSSGSSGRKSISSRSSRRSSSKPYSRTGNVEDKRVRKKEQNKNAATRYRQKKKQEIKEILGEEHELAAKNDKLQSQVKDLQREIGYLKGLMRDLFKAKGLMK